MLVVVKDTGGGLDPAVASRMFQPFFTTKPPRPGSQLAICSSNCGSPRWAPVVAAPSTTGPKSA